MTVLSALDSGDEDFFALPRTILVESASAWKADKIELLGIDTEVVSDFQSVLVSHFPAIGLPEEVSAALEAQTVEVLGSLKHVTVESTLNVDGAVTVEELGAVEKALLIMTSASLPFRNSLSRFSSAP